MSYSDRESQGSPRPVTSDLAWNIESSSSRSTKANPCQSCWLASARSAVETIATAAYLFNDPGNLGRNVAGKLTSQTTIGEASKVIPPIGRFDLGNPGLLSL